MNPYWFLDLCIMIVQTLDYFYNLFVLSAMMPNYLFFFFLPPQLYMHMKLKGIIGKRLKTVNIMLHGF